MQDYLMLFKEGEAEKTFSPEQMQEYMGRWGGWIKSLNEKGVFKAGEPLENVGKKVSGKDGAVSDGPHPESKEFVGGYLIVNAADIDAACELARGCPILEVKGFVEVRPLAEM